MRKYMIIVKAQMGQLMEAMQDLAKGQEEAWQDNLRTAIVNPSVTLPVNPLGGTNTHVVTQLSPEGGPMYQNVAHTFNIPVNRRTQLKIDDHHDAFFTLKDDSVYDTFGPSTAEMETKLCALEEKMKDIQGFSTFGLDVIDMCMV